VGVETCNKTIPPTLPQSPRARERERERKRKREREGRRGGAERAEDLPENDVVSVKVGKGYSGDEELTCVCVRACIRHGNCLHGASACRVQRS
jgi:hypothetical protein